MVASGPDAPACPQCGKPRTMVRFTGDFALWWQDGSYRVSRATRHTIPVLFYNCGCYEQGQAAAYALIALVQGRFHA